MASTKLPSLNKVLIVGNIVKDPELRYTFLKKDSAVLVEGELRSRLKENQDGTKRSFVEIKALHVQFLDRKADSPTLS